MNKVEGGKSQEGLSHEDLCILSRIYNDREIPVPHGTNFRINEWLKAQIAGALASGAPVEVPSWVDAAALRAAKEIVALSSATWAHTQKTSRVQVIVAREMMWALGVSRT